MASIRRRTWKACSTMSALSAPAPLDPRASAIFLDLDGTLIGFGDAPMAVDVPAALLELLAALATLCDGALAVVSGRRMATLDALLAPLALPLAGLHGLERRAADGTVHCLVEAGDTLLAEVREQFEAIARRLPGLLVEDKGAALALHYRAAPHRAGEVEALVAGLERSLPARLVMQRGHMVVEVRAAGADKGSAIAAFMDEPPFRGRHAVFVGDDRTDEHGFAVVNARNGLSVKVGDGDTVARTRLAGPTAVRHWLGEAVARHQTGVNE
ncbi:MAG: trehalose-phosphatase [Gammaproteobacteria bacterium]